MFSISSNFKFAIYFLLTTTFNQLGATEMDYTVVKKDKMNVIGVEYHITDLNTASQIIGQAWGEFFQKGLSEKIPNKISGEVMGLYINYEGDHTKPYSLLICYEVDNLDEIPEGMVSKTLPESKYATFSGTGEIPKIVMNLWQKIWSTDLDRTYTGDFELYKNSDDPEKAQEKIVEIYIAIK